MSAFVDFTQKLTTQDFIQDIISVVSFIAVVIGGAFALYQWTKGNVYKRGEIVKELIKTVRDDEDIACVMDIIDWDEDFCYDGKFHLNPYTARPSLAELSDDELFINVDKTLAHFSYICYLKYRHSLKKKDMRIFDYKIRRLIDNKSIRNYLYSLHHWSASLGVPSSYDYLIKYCVEKKYIDKRFYTLDCPYCERRLVLAKEHQEV